MFPLKLRHSALLYSNLTFSPKHEVKVVTVFTQISNKRAIVALLCFFSHSDLNLECRHFKHNCIQATDTASVIAAWHSNMKLLIKNHFLFLVIVLWTFHTDSLMQSKTTVSYKLLTYQVSLQYMYDIINWNYWLATVSLLFDNSDLILEADTLYAILRDNCIQDT